MSTDPPNKPVVHETDASLLRQFRQGRPDAATQLYLRYAHRLRALAHGQASADLKTRIDSDRLVQSIFRTFFRRAAEGQYAPTGDACTTLF